jgi:hypothetical protein
LAWDDHDGPVPRLSEPELLSLARAKANALGERRRRRVLAGMVAVMVVAGASVALAVDRGADRGQELQTVSEGPGSSLPPTSTVPVASSTSLVPPPTATVPSSPKAPTSVVSRPPTTRAPATAGPTAPTTTSTRPCRDSIDPACGPFRWDPPPAANQPLTAKVGPLAPAAPRKGETVTIPVTVDDADGSSLLDTSGRDVDYGDGTPVLGISGHIDCTQGFGPWTPPAPVPLHAELRFQHAYATSGTYTVVMRFKSLGSCAYGPSETTATVTIVVGP